MKHHKLTNKLTIQSQPSQPSLQVNDGLRSAHMLNLISKVSYIETLAFLFSNLFCLVCSLIVLLLGMVQVELVVGRDVRGLVTLPTIGWSHTMNYYQPY